MTPSAIIAQLAGYGERDDCEPHDGRCWVCAGPMTRGQPVSAWSGANFTGQNRVRSPLSSHVCEACVWVCSRIAPVPGRPAKAGKQFGGNARNYSHLYEQGWPSPPFGDDDAAQLPGYVNASKGEKPLIRAFLERTHEGPWFAAIADSGQKHVVPWTPMNGPGRGGTVLMDETLVRVPSDQGLVAEMTALLTLGATKAELESGELTARAWELCGAELRAFEQRHARERHASWFRLALWLAQRDEDETKRRIDAEKEARRVKKESRKGRGTRRKAARPDGRTAARAAARVPADQRREGADSLGHTDDAHARGSTHDHAPRGVGDGDDAQARHRPAGQIRLPGFN